MNDIQRQATEMGRNRQCANDGEQGRPSQTDRREAEKGKKKQNKINSQQHQQTSRKCQQVCVLMIWKKGHNHTEKCYSTVRIQIDARVLLPNRQTRIPKSMSSISEWKTLSSRPAATRHTAEKAQNIYIYARKTISENDSPDRDKKKENSETSSFHGRRFGCYV